MRSEDVRFYRQQVEHCHNLVRLTDELRRLLSGMAAAYDARAQEAESLILQRQVESRPGPVSRPLQIGLEPLTVSIKDAAKVLGLGRSTIYRLIGEQQLETVKIGNRTLIKTASIGRLVEQP